MSVAITKLIPYWVTVREIENPDSSWDLTNIHAHESNFPQDNLTDYFEDFLNQYTGDVYMDEENQKTFTVKRPIEREGNTIEGRFMSGEWGRNADFWDIDKHERIEDAREENHAEEIPYYFLFHIPDSESDQALLILSKYKRRGIKTLFNRLFPPRTQDMDVGDAYMTINPHYSENILEKLDDADSIASVQFRGRERIAAREEYSNQQDIERVEKELSGQLNVATELKMAPEKNESGFFEYVKGLIPGEDQQSFDYGRIEDQNFSSANVTIIEGESQLTFSLWQEEIQMRMDVDAEEYKLDVHGGFPTPYSLGRVARQLANDLMTDRNTKLDTESMIGRSIGMPEDTELEQTPEQG